MIPKVIHYCWFGGNLKSEIIEKCIASWKKNCPDYQIIEWNESNWDVNKYSYAKEAYEAKKWAFVSDVARLDILLNHGGIYLDTDVEIFVPDPFGKYLKYESVLCFENARGINTGMFFASEARTQICCNFFKPYINLHFSNDIKELNTSMNRPVICAMFPNIKWDGKTQVYGNTYIIGCEEYGAIMKHYGTRSWCDNLPKYTVSKPTWLKKVMRNPKIFEKLENVRIGKKILPIYTFLAYDLQDLGPLFYIKLNINKMKSKLKKE